MKNSDKVYFLKLWGPVFIWAGLIFFFSSIPNLKIKQLGIFDFIFRKISHFTEYFILSLLLLRAIKKSFSENITSGRVLFYSIFISFVYSITDEFHQYYVPGRYTSFTDIFIDTAGAITGAILYAGIKKKNN